MKLNNNGWGYRQMLLMSGILLIFLLVAAYNVYSLYNDMDVKSASTYVNLELKLQMVAADYINDKNLNNSNVIVTLKELKEAGYIKTFNDDDSNACNGYVEYQDYDYVSYIRCRDYTSSNYNNFNE